ncbi:3-keto-5-aminohexanoate cleavage protein [Paraburkholderia guartelaensis]|uniref:3-keto-5-aminohexanoate cleavage protein n=1 Tax=Paraburkholderia guartelaensis TaxID=2546446 RepID=A0A4R5L6B2_9BURK|nr:3-keto-5-aminohexanoate cleavage protein [Paraburkholderia guartelaensis]TDG03337.1 3-keto-5-aminohexanoate cleavage protein [Paraburkholderia guartelaensis]
MATNKVIVLVAPTGGMAFKSQNPHLPTQPDEIARDVYDCYNAGASVVAVHARLPNDEATCNAEIYRSINEQIRSKCDIVINNSTGGGVHGDMIRPIEGGMWDTVWEERLKGMGAGAEMCTLDACTFVASFGGKEVLLNTSPSRCRYLAEEMKNRGIKPEWEVFSPTHIVQDVNTLIQLGLDEPPYVINMVMNAHRGFQNAMPYNPKSLQYMVDLLPEKSIFCVSGIGPAQLPASVNSLLLGGQIIRVGLEDNLYYRQGQLARNVELVERTVRILREMDYEIATPAEARLMMGLPRSDTPARPYFSLT